MFKMGKKVKLSAWLHNFLDIRGEDLFPSIFQLLETTYFLWQVAFVLHQSKQTAASLWLFYLHHTIFLDSLFISPS
jgi:hypothetical protein